MPDERDEAMRSVVSIKHYLMVFRTSLLNRLHALYVQGGITFVNKGRLAHAPRGSEWPVSLTDALRGLPPYSGRSLRLPKTR